MDHPKHPAFVNGGRSFDAAAFSTMDVARSPRVTRRRQLRRWLAGLGAVLILGGATVTLMRLQPAIPTIDKAAIWTDTVRRGPMVREVRGLGTFVPEEIRWIAAESDARVERIAIYPGAKVQPDTLILVLSNPELKQAALDADGAVNAAQASLVNLRAQLEGQSLERQAALAKAQGDSDTANAQVEVNERLAAQGLVAEVELRKSRIAAKELNACRDIERQRVDFTQQSVAPQLAVAQGQLDQARQQAALRHAHLDALQVRAGMAGVLEQVPVEVGQRVPAGTNLARVADPTRLKAQIKIPETQARDIQPGQPVSVDTRNGLVEGHVSRIDPSVQGGTVLVDTTFNGAPLPKGARPDLSVEGTVELERVPDALIVNRPASGREESTVSLFRLSPDGTRATRVQVSLGRGSVDVVEVRSGLRAGDRIILSDTSAYDADPEIRLN
jgi:HlyD family secretion protein